VPVSRHVGRALGYKRAWEWSSMSEVEGDSENITDAIEHENAISISKIRSLFVDPGFPTTLSEDAGSAAPSEKLKDSEA